jgi:diacylglycerol kinase
MNIIGWYQVKLFVEHASGISMDALHILVGFILFLLAARLLKTSVASPLPWLVLLMLELLNEAYDLHVELWPNLASQLGEGAKDILLTMALPTVLGLLARWRPVLFSPTDQQDGSANDQMAGGS